MIDDEAPSYPLIGSVQNSVGMGFIGNQASFAIVNALGGRMVHAWTQFSNAHPGIPGRTTTTIDVAQLRRDVAFIVAQRPGVIHVGYLPKPAHVDAVAVALKDHRGIVLVDPVIGDYKKGLFVSEETARAIKEWLIPMAQIITPNRFEAEVLLGTGDPDMSEYAYLNGLFDLGPNSVIITSFSRDEEKHRTTSLFTNGYSYNRIHSQYFPRFNAYGVGDTFAAAVAAFVGLGGSPFAAALLATGLASRAVANTTTYGGMTVDPIGALSKWNPLGYQAEDEKAMRFCERSGVTVELLRPTGQEGTRLKFAPPRQPVKYE